MIASGSRNIAAKVRLVAVQCKTLEIPMHTHGWLLFMRVNYTYFKRK